MSSWQQQAVQLLLHVHLQLLSELLLVVWEPEWLSWLLLLAWACCVRLWLIWEDNLPLAAPAGRNPKYWVWTLDKTSDSNPEAWTYEETLPIAQITERNASLQWWRMCGMIKKKRTESLCFSVIITGAS